jgi:hypothetical protein
MAQPINIPAQIDIVKVSGISKVSTTLNVSPGLTKSLVDLNKALINANLSARTLKSSLNFSQTVGSNLFAQNLGDINKVISSLEKIRKLSNAFNKSPKDSTFKKLAEEVEQLVGAGDEANRVLSGIVQQFAEKRTANLLAKEKQAIKDRYDFEQAQIKKLEESRRNLIERQNKRFAVDKEARQEISTLTQSNETFRNQSNLNRSQSFINTRRDDFNAFLQRVKGEAKDNQEITKLIQSNEQFRTKSNLTKSQSFINERRDDFNAFLQRAKAEAKYNKDAELSQRALLKNAKSITGEIERHHISARQFGEAIGLASKRFLAFILPSGALYSLAVGIKTAIKDSLEFEKILTRINQAIGGSRSIVSNKIGGALINLARQTGTPATEIGKGIFTLAQAGFQDTKELAGVAEKLSKIPLSATFDDIATTVDGLLSIFGQFNKRLSETGEIFDVVNQFAADFAVESKDIFEITKRGGATFSVAGGSFIDFIKLSSTLRETTRQNPETIGTFFKTATAQLFKPNSQKLLRGLGVKEGSITEQLEQLSKVFAERFGPSVSGPGAVAVATELVGTRQLDKLLGLLRGLNDTKLQGRINESLSKVSGSFDRSAQKRIDDIGSSLDRLKESLGAFFKVAINNNGLRSFFNLFSDGAEAVSSLSENFAKFTPQLLSFIAVLGAPALKEIGQGFRGKLFGLNPKELKTFLDAKQTSLTSDLAFRFPNLSQRDRDAQIASTISDLRVSLGKEGKRPFFTGGGKILGIGALLAGTGLLDDLVLSKGSESSFTKRSNLGGSINSGLSGGLLANAFGLGGLGSAFIGVTLGLNTLIKSLTTARKVAIESANNFTDLSEALSVTSGTEKLELFIEQLKSVFTFNFSKATLLQEINRGDQFSRAAFLTEQIDNNTGVGGKLAQLSTNIIAKALQQSGTRAKTGIDQRSNTSIALQALLNSKDFANATGLDTNSKEFNDLAEKLARGAKPLIEFNNFLKTIDNNFNTEIETTINKYRLSLLKFQQGSVDFVKNATETIDQLSSITTNPLDLITARLPKDPITAINKLSNNTLSNFGLDPDSTRSIVSFTDDLLNKQIKNLTNFLTNSSIPDANVPGQTLGELRSNALRSIANILGTKGEEASRLGQTGKTSPNTGFESSDIVSNLRSQGFDLGFFDKSGKPSSVTQTLQIIQTLRKFESGAQVAAEVLDNLDSIIQDLNKPLAELRNQIESQIEIFNKRLEIESQISAGIRETNNQLFEFTQRLQDLGTQLGERNINFNAGINRTNPNIVNAQTAALLRSSTLSSFGDISTFAGTARNSANIFSRARNSAQSARIEGNFDKSVFEEAQKSLSNFQDIQSELNQRLTESANRVNLLSRVTDLLKTSFESLRDGINNVGQTLLGTSQIDFAAGLFPRPSAGRVRKARPSNRRAGPAAPGAARGTFRGGTPPRRRAPSARACGRS